MKLYIASFSDYDGQETIGIFSSTEEAEKAIKDYKKKYKPFYKYEDIEEFTLNKLKENDEQT